MLLYLLDLLARAIVANLARLIALKLWAWLRRPRPAEDWNTMRE